jgi:hypothetical protein
MLVDHLLREGRVRSQIDLEVTIPDAEPMPVAGPAAGGMVRAVLAQRGISLRSSARPAGGLLPKAGVMAERQGEVVAGNLLEALEGRAGGEQFDGSGECFFELGDGQAMRMEGHFFRPVADRVDAGPPSAEALADKERFERERLERWFG